MQSAGGRGGAYGKGGRGRGAWSSDGAADPAVALNMQISRSSSLAELLETTREARDRMNLVNCVTSLQKAVKLDSRPLEASALAHVTSRAVECFQQAGGGCQPRHVSGVLWASAKLATSPAALVDAALARGVGMRAEWFKPQEISMSVWAVGKLGLDNGAGVSFVAALMPSVLSRVGEFDSQGLANVVTGLVTVGGGDGLGFAPRLMAALRERLGQLNAQEPNAPAVWPPRAGRRVAAAHPPLSFSRRSSQTPSPASPSSAWRCTSATGSQPPQPPPCAPRWDASLRSTSPTWRGPSPS